MTNFKNVPVIVPSYNPDEKLKNTVAGLLSEGFTDVIVIDDGSREDTKSNFPEEGNGVTVLRHEINRGKGAGLKTAFSYILKNRPDAVGCVTADGDGQHRPEDIAACVEKMLACPDNVVLGVRDFSLPGVPERSRKGNRITCTVFRLLFGMKLTDTQTGLRAIPRACLEDFLSVRGDRYEYETNMLLEMKRSAIPFSEVGIETVYINENETSHFRPVRDSIRIYGLICAFLLSSILSAVLDIGLFHVFNLLLTSRMSVPFDYFIAVAGARIISSAVNYTLNRRAVFGRGDKASVVRYYVLAVAILVISGALGSLLTFLIPESLSWIDTLVKAVIDAVMFLASFRIQHEWVFRKGGSK